MIQPNELRIGNHVHVTVPSAMLGNLVAHVYISAIAKGHVCVCDVVEEVSLYAIDGIPLTPEILEKCGFKHNMGGWYLEGGIEDAIMQNCEHGWCMTLDEITEDDIHFRLGYSTVLIKDAPARHIKYLHQLQNLHFALTGEELNVQL